MSTPEQSQIRTRMFARMMGPFLTIVPITVAVRGSYMQTLFNEFKANPMWPWLYGAILLAGGLFIIAFHQYWRSPAAVIVSVVGWFFAIRGVLLLTAPQAYDAAGNAVYSSGCVCGDVGVVHLPCFRRALPDLRRLEAGIAHAKSRGGGNPGSPACRG